jgi:magnesium transporter
MRVWSLVDGRWCEGEQGAGPYWFDVHRADEAALRALASRFGLHQLAIDDCLSPYLHAPKLEDFGGYLFLILATMAPGEDGPAVEELDAFVGAGFLVTYHDGPGEPPSIAAVAAAVGQDMHVRPGTSGLLYEVIDRSVDEMVARVTSMSAALDDIEEQILGGREARTGYRKALSRRADAGQLRRLLTTQQQAMMRLGRDDFPMVVEGNRPYFRDVYDHLLRVDLLLEEIREDSEVALSMYLSALNNRLSEVMKVLAVVSALALPGTLITGVFGTNFDNVPGLHSNWGFALMMAGIVGAALGMGYFFRRRGWF